MPNPQQPIFGQKPNACCAKCLFEFRNRQQWKLDAQGRRVCRAGYACELKAKDMPWLVAMLQKDSHAGR